MSKTILESYPIFPVFLVELSRIGITGLASLIDYKIFLWVYFKPFIIEIFKQAKVERIAYLTPVYPQRSFINDQHMSNFLFLLIPYSSLN